MVQKAKLRFFQFFFWHYVFNGEFYQVLKHSSLSLKIYYHKKIILKQNWEKKMTVSKFFLFELLVRFVFSIEFIDFHASKWKVFFSTLSLSIFQTFFFIKISKDYSIRSDTAISPVCISVFCVIFAFWIIDKHRSCRMRFETNLNIYKLQVSICVRLSISFLFSWSVTPVLIKLKWIERVHYHIHVEKVNWINTS